MARRHLSCVVGGKPGEPPMRLLQLSLNAKDQATVRSTVAFLEGRLEEKETIEWALRSWSRQYPQTTGDPASAKHTGRKRPP